MWHSKSKETQLKSHAHLSGSASRSPQNQLICVKAREAQILQKKCELMECQGALKLKAIFTVFTSSWRWKSRPWPLRLLVHWVSCCYSQGHISLITTECCFFILFCYAYFANWGVLADRIRGIWHINTEKTSRSEEHSGQSGQRSPTQGEGVFWDKELDVKNTLEESFTWDHPCLSFRDMYLWLGRTLQVLVLESFANKYP